MSAGLLSSTFLHEQLNRISCEDKIVLINEPEFLQRLIDCICLESEEANCGDVNKTASHTLTLIGGLHVWVASNTYAMSCIVDIIDHNVWPYMGVTFMGLKSIFHWHDIIEPYLTLR